MNVPGGVYGFVLRYTPAESGRLDALDVVHTSTDTVAVGRGFRLFCRPFRTTPEALTEEFPTVTSCVVLAYSGRVDNRRELIGMLGNASLSHAGDGTLLAAAYERWGNSFPARVVGEYSFALIDRQTGRLVAARDAMGIGRLFRCEDSRTLWVGSTLEVLLSAMPSRPSYDLSALADYVAGGGLLMSGRTIFHDLAEVPPAHLLVRSARAEHVQRYWEPDPERRIVTRDEREYDEMFRALLFDAVAASLRTSENVWSDMSGGLDSSTVTAVAASLRSSGRAPDLQVIAFSQFASLTEQSDESSYQQAFLARWPMEQRALDIDAYPSFSIDEPPSFHPSKAILYRPIWHAATDLLAADGVAAHLTGRGGDNLFCGDGFPPVHLADVIRQFGLRRWRNELLEWSRVGRRSLWNLVWHCSRQRLNDQYAGAANRTEAPPWLSEEFYRLVVSAESVRWHGGARLYSSAARELQYRSIMQTAAVARFIRVGDERHPLLYRPLVEFVLALPWEQLIRADQDRVIQRRAMSELLPEAIRGRKSKASGTPLLLRGIRENWSRVEPNARGSMLAQFGLVNPTKFEAACLRLRHGLLAKQFHYLAGALSLEIWLAANEKPHRDRSVTAHFASDLHPFVGCESVHS